MSFEYDFCCVLFLVFVFFEDDKLVKELISFYPICGRQEHRHSTLSLRQIQHTFYYGRNNKYIIYILVKTGKRKKKKRQQENGTHVKRADVYTV